MKMENEINDIKINIQNPSLNISSIKESNINNDSKLLNNSNVNDTSIYLYKLDKFDKLDKLDKLNKLDKLDTKIKNTKEDDDNREKFYKKTPNTKIQILTQEIYLNRKNIIKNSEKSKFKINAKFVPINTSLNSQNLSFHNISNNIHAPFKNESFSSIDKLNIHSYSNENEFLKKDDENTFIITEPNSIISSRFNSDKKCKSDNKLENTIKNLSEISSEINISETEKTSPDLTDSTDSLDSINTTNSSVETGKHEFKDKFYKEHKRRHYRRFGKIRKKNTNDVIENCINENEYIDDLSQSDCSPRNIDISLWNDDVENYYIEFQKICVSESVKYKQLNHRDKLLSNLLKFILLISSCFTFTLSLSSPDSVFFQVTTTITSILTTIITSIISFFAFEKRSEIEYYIYKGLDRINQTISIELIKPSQIRSDPYELILTLQNQRDELLKKLHKKV